MFIKIIDCTEKSDKNIEDIINFLINYFDSLNIKNERIKFKDFKIVKCTQCRCCTLIKSDSPTKCVIKDDMNDLLDKIEEATAFVIVADRNDLFNRNRLFEKVESRLIAYHYWPYSQTHSTPRKTILDKTSILINYNTTKYFMNHSFYMARMYMEEASISIGAKVLDWQAIIPTNDLIKDYAKRLKEMADKLIINSK